MLFGLDDLCESREDMISDISFLSVSDLITIDNIKSKSQGNHVAKAILELQVTVYHAKLFFKAVCNTFKFANYISVRFSLFGRITTKNLPLASCLDQVT